MKGIAVLVSTAALLTGCIFMVPGHLYPIQGSLAAQTPVPIYRVTLSGVLNSGTLSATLENGEICRGNWAAVPQNDPSAGNLSVEWDRIYGDGFFVANILGSSAFARAVLTGTMGTTLNAEFYAPVPGQMINIKGIAVDNRGNLFKLTF